MSDALANSYDTLPYTSYCYDRSHPAHLHAVASIFGMRPAPVTACRVLELGCAAGGNLLPMAALLPGSRFIGLDRSGRQTADANRLRDESGLPNAEFHHADILSVDESWGTFDYVICHGVYSWVPPSVQAHILDIMHRCLAPQGVGYVSYNVYPGWHMRDMVRHMMRYHVRSLETPEEQTTQARALLDFLGRSVPKESTYGMMLHQELNLLQHAKSDYIYHEHLEELNEPLYFHEFAERLEAHHLRYVAETDLHTMMVSGYSDAIAQTLHRVASDIISMEQYLDFVRNRQFRASVICHQEVELQRSLEPALVPGYRFEFAAAEPGPVDLSPDVSHEFVTGEDIRLSTSRPITKAAFLTLRRKFPRAIPFEELWTVAHQLLCEAGLSREHVDDRELLGADLLSAVFSGAIRLRTWQAPMTTSPGLYPYVPRTTRVLARHLGFAPSLNHRTIHLNRAQQMLVPLFDGEHSQAALTERLVEAVLHRELQLTKDGQAIEDPATVTPMIQSLFQTLMADFAGKAVFIRPEDDPSA